MSWDMCLYCPSQKDSGHCLESSLNTGQLCRALPSAVPEVHKSPAKCRDKSQQVLGKFSTNFRLNLWLQLPPAPVSELDLQLWHSYLEFDNMDSTIRAVIPFVPPHSQLYESPLSFLRPWGRHSGLFRVGPNLFTESRGCTCTFNRRHQDNAGD